MNGREPYLSAAATLLRESGCVVVKWRTAMTGVAYTRRPDWEIEVPEPRGPVSYGVLAHEVAHQELHRPDRRSRKLRRWQEELEAWEWAHTTFERFDLPGIEKSRADARDHLRGAAGKALRVVTRRGQPAYYDLARRIDAEYPAWVELREWLDFVPWEQIAA